MLTTITTMLVAMALTVATVPKIYCAFMDAKLLHLEEELELLRELQVERNECMLRHLGCGLGALILIWLVQSSPDLVVPNQMAPAMAIYAAGSLLFALLESLLVHKIDHWLAAGPAAGPGRMEMHNHR